MTKAEEYRAKRPKDWSSVEEMLFWIESEIDAEAFMFTDELGVVVQFSDGSIHRLGDKR